MAEAQIYEYMQVKSASFDVMTTPLHEVHFKLDGL